MVDIKADEKKEETDKDIKNYFEKLLLKVKIEIDDEKKEKMLKFLYILYEKNKVMNLTAIREKKEIIER